MPARSFRHVLRRTWLVVAMTTLLGLMLVPSAAARQPNNAWNTNQVVGNCAGQTGGYVVAAQVFLFASNGYSPADNFWGTNSNNAVRSLQAQFGISVDGCVGPSTWSRMRSFVFSRCSPGIVCNRPNHEARINGGRTFYDRTNCDWGSFTNVPVGGPVRSNFYYSFDTRLTGAVTCV